MGIKIDKGRAVTAAEAGTRRFTELLRSGVDPNRTAIGEWSTGDVAAHTAYVFSWMLEIAKGNPSPVADVAQISAASAAALKAETERDPRVLADRIDETASAFFDVTQGATGDPPVVWHGGITLRLSVMPAIALGEVVVHGLDVARTEGRPWPIDPGDARIVIAGGSHLLPYFVDPSAGDLDARYELNVRGDSTIGLTFEKGHLTVHEGRVKRADCRLSVDPVAYLLVGYRRVGQWKLMATGKLFAYGRKPWLGLKLARAFNNP